MDKTLSYNQLYKYSLFFRKVLYRTVLERLRRLRARLVYREAAGCHEASRQAHCEAFLLCIFLRSDASIPDSPTDLQTRLTRLMTPVIWQTRTFRMQSRMPWMNFGASHQKPTYSDLCTGYLDGIRCFALWGRFDGYEKAAAERFLILRPLSRIIFLYPGLILQPSRSSASALLRLPHG